MADKKSKKNTEKKAEKEQSRKDFDAFIDLASVTALAAANQALLAISREILDAQKRLDKKLDEIYNNPTKKEES